MDSHWVITVSYQTGTEMASYEKIVGGTFEDALTECYKMSYRGLLIEKGEGYSVIPPSRIIELEFEEKWTDVED